MPRRGTKGRKGGRYDGQVPKIKVKDVPQGTIEMDGEKAWIAGTDKAGRARWLRHNGAAIPVAAVPAVFAPPPRPALSAIEVAMAAPAPAPVVLSPIVVNNDAAFGEVGNKLLEHAGKLAEIDRAHAEAMVQKLEAGGKLGGALLAQLAKAEELDAAFGKVEAPAIGGAKHIAPVTSKLSSYPFRCGKDELMRNGACGDGKVPVMIWPLGTGPDAPFSVVNGKQPQRFDACCKDADEVTKIMPGIVDDDAEFDFLGLDAGIGEDDLMIAFETARDELRHFATRELTKAVHGVNSVWHLNSARIRKLSKPQKRKAKQLIAAVNHVAKTIFAEATVIGNVSTWTEAVVIGAAAIVPGAMPLLKGVESGGKLLDYMRAEFYWRTQQLLSYLNTHVIGFDRYGIEVAWAGYSPIAKAIGSRVSSATRYLWHTAKSVGMTGILFAVAAGVVAAIKLKTQGKSAFTIASMTELANDGVTRILVPLLFQVTVEWLHARGADGDVGAEMKKVMDFFVEVQQVKANTNNAFTKAASEAVADLSMAAASSGMITAALMGMGPAGLTAGVLGGAATTAAKFATAGGEIEMAMSTGKLAAYGMAPGMSAAAGVYALDLFEDNPIAQMLIRATWFGANVAITDSILSAASSVETANSWAIMSAVAGGTANLLNNITGGGSNALGHGVAWLAGKATSDMFAEGTTGDVAAQMFADGYEAVQDGFFDAAASIGVPRAKVVQFFADYGWQLVAAVLAVVIVGSAVNSSAGTVGELAGIEDEVVDVEREIRTWARRRDPAFFAGNENVFLPYAHTGVMKEYCESGIESAMCEGLVDTLAKIRAEACAPHPEFKDEPLC